VSAPALENAVVGQLRGIGRNPVLLDEVLRQLGGHRLRECDELEKEKADINRELKKIAQEMNVAVSVVGGRGRSSERATSQLAELQGRLSHLNGRIAEIHQQLVGLQSETVDPRDVEKALQEFDPLWEQFSTWEKERFIRTLVEQIRYDGKTGTVTLGFRSQGIKDLCDWAPGPMEQNEHTQRCG
jgi:site-specific DNA recombinase